jgi:hypothetical protein
MTALFYSFSLKFYEFLSSYELISFYSFFSIFLTYSEFIDFLQSLSTFYRVYWLSTEFIDFLQSLLTFCRLQKVLYRLFSNFSKYFTDFFPTFYRVLSTLSSFYRVYRLLSFLSTFIVFIDFKIRCFFVPTFTDFILTFPTVNRKFLITDFRLLSTSVKPKNFIDFYRSQKKVKDPRCLVNTIKNIGSYSNLNKCWNTKSTFTSDSWSQCYEYFYGRNLRIFVIS